ncbi:hypothetical protein R50912_01650 [Paenibacillus sp. FSL R5-0912]|nr:hypothetical protein R50912_01650 [Paenibacillus sp. FSL R5-0912]
MKKPKSIGRSVTLMNQHDKNVTLDCINSMAGQQNSRYSMEVKEAVIMAKMIQTKNLSKVWKTQVVNYTLPKRWVLLGQ